MCVYVTQTTLTLTQNVILQRRPVAVCCRCWVNLSLLHFVVIFFCSALSPRNRKNEHQISDICNGNSNASHYIITALSSYTRRTFLFISNTFEGFINGQTERAPCTDPTVLRKCTFGGAIQFDLSLTTRVSVSYQRICHPAIHRFHPHCGLSH